MIMENLQKNFSRERSTVAYNTSTLRSERALERRKGQVMANGCEKKDKKEENFVSHSGNSDINKPERSFSHAEKITLDPLEAGWHRVEHQTLEPGLQEDWIKASMQCRSERAVSIHWLEV